MYTCRDQDDEWLKEKISLFLVLLNALDIATVTQETLELGLLEFKKDSTRVPLPIIQIWAGEQWSQKERLSRRAFWYEAMLQLSGEKRPVQEFANTWDYWACIARLAYGKSEPRENYS